MTSVPKPLKFLRPHYGKLKEIYESMAPGENKVRLSYAARKMKQYVLITKKYLWIYTVNTIN